MIADKESHEKLVTATLSEWGAKLDLLEAKVAKAGAAGGVALGQKLAELRALHLSGKDHLTEIGRSGVSLWDGARTNAKKRWTQLSATAEGLWSSIKT
jgi:hypothetical protein